MPEQPHGDRCPCPLPRRLPRKLALAGLTYAAVVGDQVLTAQLRLNLAISAYWSGAMYECLIRLAPALSHVPDGLIAARLQLIRAVSRLGASPADHHYRIGAALA